MLLQGAFAAACGLHGLGHGGEAGAVQVHASESGETSGERFDRHELCHAGHGCLHVFGPACAPATHVFVAGASRPPSSAAHAVLSVTPGTLLRPPIDA